MSAVRTGRISAQPAYASPRKTSQALGTVEHDRATLQRASNEVVPEAPAANQHAMTPEENTNNTELLIREIERFPTLPDVATLALEELERPDCDFDEVASLVSLDPVLASRILRMANSAYFGAVHKAENVDAALCRLGIRECRALILTVALMDSIPDLPSPVSAKSFWTLSLASALISQKIAEDIGYPSPERAYLAGLVHLLGQAVLAIQFTDRFRHAVELGRRDQLPLVVALTEEFGCDHAGLTAHILRRWSFPEEVTHAIRYQFTPSAARNEALLASLIVAGDGMCRDFELALEDFGYSVRSWLSRIDPCLEQALRAADLGTTVEYFDRLAEPAQEAIDFALTIF